MATTGTVLSIAFLLISMVVFFMAMAMVGSLFTNKENLFRWVRKELDQDRPHRAMQLCQGFKNSILANCVRDLIKDRQDLEKMNTTVDNCPEYVKSFRPKMFKYSVIFWVPNIFMILFLIPFYVDTRALDPIPMGAASAIFATWCAIGVLMLCWTFLVHISIGLSMKKIPSEVAEMRDELVKRYHST